MAAFFWLLLGIVLAGGFVWVAAVIPSSKSKTFAVGLVIAAVIYVAFAGIQLADWRAFSIEVVGLLLYGGLAWKGWKGDPGWLVVGWGAHPLWDIGLHLGWPTLNKFGALWQAGIVPQWYVLLCSSFDITIAVYLYSQSRRLSGKDSKNRV